MNSKRKFIKFFCYLSILPIVFLDNTFKKKLNNNFKKIKSGNLYWILSSQDI